MLVMGSDGSDRSDRSDKSDGSDGRYPLNTGEVVGAGEGRFQPGGQWG